MKVLYLFNFLLLSYIAVGQSKDHYRTYIKLSGGRAFFGTGDIRGFGVYAELSHNVINTPQPFCARLLVGGEISFENGVINPVVKNPPASEMYIRPFHHTSTTGLAAKLSWYPFTGFLPGFHIAVGPVLAYTFQSWEAGTSMSTTEPVRQSQLEFDNRLVPGYRIGTGYEFFLGERCVAGIRADFSNYNNGDVNTLLAAKLGYRF